MTSSARTSNVGGQGESQCLGRLEIDHELIFGWNLYRQVGWLRTTEDAIDVSGYPPELVDRIRMR
jgi:hypothetical protein